MDQSVSRTQYDPGTVRKFKRMSCVAALEYLKMGFTKTSKEKMLAFGPREYIQLFKWCAQWNL